ncbi:MAG TPA: hypothetical protein VLD37_07300 [Candidatus Bilamarchaeum sp.]|nr:hypothetical protein [Candidatus Bilamarchaeum sp.]
MHAYRTAATPLGRRGETLSRLRKMVGAANEPLVDCISCECGAGDALMLRLFEKISDLVTDWYTAYLLREVKNASDYDEAFAPASLLAFSFRSNCIDQLGELLLCRNPLSVLVAIETLSDIVALGPESPQRSMAAYHLSASRIPLAQDELDEAVAFSRLGRPREPVFIHAPLPLPVPCAAFYSVSIR